MRLRPLCLALPGYAEADCVRLASPIGGILTRLHLNRSGKAPALAPAFVLRQESERSARQEAVLRVARAENQRVNLRQGKRPDELAAIQAQLAQARLEQANWRVEHKAQRIPVVGKMVLQQPGSIGHICSARIGCGFNFPKNFGRSCLGRLSG